MSAKTHIDHVAETIDEIGPFAFPFTVKESGQFITNHGMTLRDWFAGQALANKFTEDETSDENVARWAYRVADAMLAAREAKP